MSSPKKKRSIKKVIAFVGSAAGVIVFLITIAGAIQYFKAPRVKVISGGPVSLSYKRAENVIEMSFDLTFDNTGYGSEVIRSTNARVINWGVPPPANFIPFANTGLLFTESNGATESAPITIAADQTKKLKCVLRHTPGGISTTVIERAGKLHLFVNLFGKKKYLDMFGEEKHYAIEFCIESNGSSLKTLSERPDIFNSVSCPER